MNAGLSFATFGENFTSDMTDDEKLNLLGYDESINAQPLNSLTYACKTDDTVVCSGDQDIDWVALDRVHAVKDQGYCGSCWSFAAVLALESVAAIEADTSAVRLSEQEGVDCTSNTTANRDKFGKWYGTYGCGGGWMEYYWDFSRDNGSMLDSDYPYTGYDESCKHEDADAVVRAGAMTSLSGDVQDLKDAIQTAPFTIAVGAGNTCWYNYEEGILSYRDNCGIWLDHAVTVVGLGTETVTYEWEEPAIYKYKCRISWSGLCNSNKIRRRYFFFTYCCSKKMKQEAQSFSETVDQEYWLVQNSWGTGWGDAGFIKIAVEDGVGVSGMNRVAE